MSAEPTAVKKTRVTERKFRGVTLPTAGHKVIRRVKRDGHEPSIHGTKLWRSSFLIMDYLHKHRPGVADNVLDAGCGWGITGIWCARKFGASVVSLDADPAVFPYLNAVAELNNVTTTPMVRRFEQLKKSQLASFDLLVAADVCFWDELVKPVGKLIDRAIDAGVGQIVIADPERPTFHEMAEKAISRHGGDLIHWSIKGKLKATGALLVINNQ
ncbi:MAG: methyltransferase domain-containing protein [Luminiphilus sp.]|nr:methyltransferase domain-containing protein [Luminiphilus sp.]MDG2442346.1 methyltransferase domain-containing protein [Luminiphilus sp.]